MAEQRSIDERPWSARKPQNYLLSAVLIGVAIALVIQGFAFINEGVGGVIPYVIILGGPALAVYYTWYFTMRTFGSDSTQS